MRRKIKIFIKRYGVKGLINHIFYYLNTICFYKTSRLIRLPLEIRGPTLINFGHNLTTGKNCRIEAFVDESNYLSQEKVIIFGNNVVLNDCVHIAGKYSVKIGSHVLVGSKVFITDHNHGTYSGISPHSSPDIPPNNRALNGSPVVIEDNVWLGEFTAVLPGVTIGEGSIIGALSVVTKSIPKYSIAVGSPARVIKIFNKSKNIWENVP